MVMNASMPQSLLDRCELREALEFRVGTYSARPETPAPALSAEVNNPQRCAIPFALRAQGVLRRACDQVIRCRVERKEDCGPRGVPPRCETQMPADDGDQTPSSAT